MAKQGKGFADHYCSRTCFSSSRFPDPPPSPPPPPLPPRPVPSSSFTRRHCDSNGIALTAAVPITTGIYHRPLPLPLVIPLPLPPSPSLPVSTVCHCHCHCHGSHRFHLLLSLPLPLAPFPSLPSATAIATATVPTTTDIYRRSFGLASAFLSFPLCRLEIIPYHPEGKDYRHRASDRGVA